MPSLIIVSGDQAGAHFVLGQRTLSIGREPARDIQVTDPKVSRKHALVRHEDGDHVISPAKALNGVIINGDAIDNERALKDGDVITLGDTNLQYSLSDNPDATNMLHHRKDAARENRDKNTLM